jgi:hypothetical protein
MVPGKIMLSHVSSAWARERFPDSNFLGQAIMKIPIYHWGGSPIRVFASGTETQASDRATFKAWSGRLSDPANANDDWLTWVKKGRVWFEGSSNDHQSRLLLRPFYQDSGVRPQWAFCGFVFPISAGEPAVWATVLRRLLEVREDDLVPSDGNLIIEEIVPWKVIKECPFPVGQVFDGSHSDALSHLCDSIASCTWKDLESLHIACHPPSAFPSVNSLVLSDNFPIKNIRILKEDSTNLRYRAESSPALVPPHLPKMEGGSEKKREKQDSEKSRHPLLVLILWLVIGFFMGWYLRSSNATDALTSCEKRITDLISKNEQLESKNVVLNRQLASEVMKNKKLREELILLKEEGNIDPNDANGSGSVKGLNH